MFNKTRLLAIESQLTRIEFLLINLKQNYKDSLIGLTKGVQEKNVKKASKQKSQQL